MNKLKELTKVTRQTKKKKPNTILVRSGILLERVTEIDGVR